MKGGFTMSDKKGLSEKQLEKVVGGSLKPDQKVKVVGDKCVSCGACARQCSYDAIDMSSGKAQVTANCARCGACVDACPAEAIIVTCF